MLADGLSNLGRGWVDMKLRQAVVLIAVVLAVIAGGCSSSEGGSAQPASSPVATKSSPSPVAASSSSNDGDASSRLACSHFFNVASDASAGVLTDAELREKLKEVNNDAKVSDVAGVRNAARAMLAAATSGDGDAFTTAVTAMGNACRAAGS
jgi:hypothetical protein